MTETVVATHAPRAPQRHRWQLLPPALAIAGRQLRQIWRLVAILIIGMVLVETLVMATPLYAKVAMNSALRQNLQAAPGGLTTNVTLDANYLSNAQYRLIDGLITGNIKQNVGTYLNGPPLTSLELPAVPIARLAPDGSPIFTPHSMTVISTPVDAIAPRLHIASCGPHCTEGRLPDPRSTALEIVILKATADFFHLSLNSTIPLVAYIPSDLGIPDPPVRLYRIIPAQVVGFVDPPDPTNSFWSQHNFATTGDIESAAYTFKAFASQQSLLDQLDHIHESPNRLGGRSSFPVHVAVHLQWVYAFNPNSFDVDHLDQAITGFNALTNIVQAASYFPNTSNARLTSLLLTADNPLTAFQNRIIFASVPVYLLVAGMLALALVFAGLLAEVIISRQAGAVLTMRGWGVRRRHLYMALLLLCGAICVVTLAAGLALTLPAARLIAQHNIPPGGSSALTLLDGDPLILLQGVTGFGLAVIAGVALAFALAAVRVTRGDILGRRATQGTIWQRLNLDLIAAFLALATGIGAAYVTRSIASGNAFLGLLLTPIAIVTPICILVAGVLLALRTFTVTVRGAAWVANRGRGAVASLALTQLARAPGRALRSILLLVVALAFALLVTAFQTTQIQHDRDVAAFRAGADFSGTLLANAPFTQHIDQQIAQMTAAYQAVPGVRAATLGTIKTATTPSTTQAIQNFTLQAVDASTFAAATGWPAQLDGDRLAGQMQHLVAGRATIQPGGAIPAILDGATWRALNLAPGTTFTLNVGTEVVTFQAFDQVPAIPLTAANTGGILIDLLSYDAYFSRSPIAQLPPDHLWLRSADDAASLQSVRSALTAGPLALSNTMLRDRRQLIAAAAQEPLFIILQGVVVIAGALPLVLALIGYLVAALTQARQQITNFAVIRALGASSRQVLRILFIEQATVVLVSLALGSALGWALATTLIPSFIFTGALPGTTGDDLFIIRSALITPIAWSSLVLALIGGLLALALVAIVLMTNIVVRPALNQRLRVDDEWVLAQEQDEPAAGAGSSRRRAHQLQRTMREHAVNGRASGTPLSGGGAGALALRQGRGNRLGITLSLAGWQTRQTWWLGLNLLTGLVIAVALVGASPLATRAAEDVGLWRSLQSSPDNLRLTLNISANTLSHDTYAAINAALPPLVQRQVGSYLAGEPLAIVQTDNAPLRTAAGGDVNATKRVTLSLLGAPIEQIASHLQITAGRLPNPQAQGLEVALPADANQGFPIKLGTTYAIDTNFGAGQQALLPVTVVGTFTVRDPQSDFWQGLTLGTSTYPQGTDISGLAPFSSLLATLEVGRSDISGQTGKVVPPPLGSTLTWRYAIEPTRFEIQQLAQAADRFIQLGTAFTGAANIPETEKAQIAGALLEAQNPLTTYRDQATNAQIPGWLLLAGAVGLAIFFATVMAELLIERQAGTIAVWRSRGFSRALIFGALTCQMVVIAGVALVAGGLLAPVAAAALVTAQLGLQGTNAIVKILASPLDIVAATGVNALITVGCAILAIAFAVWRAARLDILALRREAARTARRPLWQRWNLDLIGAGLALLALIIARYVQASLGGYDSQIDRFVSLVQVFAPLFAVVAGLLFFLRYFDRAVGLAQRLVNREGRRGDGSASPFPWARRAGTSTRPKRDDGKKSRFWAPGDTGIQTTLALTQMARAPRQALRVILLLTVAIAFMIVIVGFTASQRQRAEDVARFAASGADFSGLTNRPAPSMLEPTDFTLRVDEQSLEQKHGIISATFGFVIPQLMIPPAPQNPVLVQAVDILSYAQSVQWPPGVSVADLMHQLRLGQNEDRVAIVPAIVDSSIWNALHLHTGDTFTLVSNGLSSRGTKFEALAEVPVIPGAPLGDGGIMVDYTTYLFAISAASPPNAFWLRTDGSPAALNAVRQWLAGGDLSATNVQDRAQIATQIEQDPLDDTLWLIATIGVILALLLALMGEFVASWLGVRQRLTNFAVLRAMGADRSQLTGVLFMEQGLIVALAVVLGLIAGWFVAGSLIPPLIFTPTPPGVTLSGDQSYLLQSTPPIQVVIPSAIGLILLGALVLGGLALVNMVRGAERQSASQVLRLNED